MRGTGDFEHRMRRSIQASIVAKKLLLRNAETMTQPIVRTY
jgi:hypothetical protein